MLREAVDAYKGNGLYSVKIDQLVVLMVQAVSDSPFASSEAPDEKPSKPQLEKHAAFARNQAINLMNAAIKQLEFYFSDKNYEKDVYLKKHAADRNGWVAVDELMQFNKMRELMKTLNK